MPGSKFAWNFDAETLKFSASRFIDAGEKRANEIAGVRLTRPPSPGELMRGYPPLRDDLLADIGLYVAKSSGLDLPDEVRRALDYLGVAPEHGTAVRLWRLCTDRDSVVCEPLVDRAAWYAAVFGARDARRWLLERHSLDDDLHAIAYRTALGSGSFPHLDDANAWVLAYQDIILELGFDELRVLTVRIAEHDFWSGRVDAAQAAAEGQLKGPALVKLAHPVAQIVEVRKPQPDPNPPADIDLMEHYIDEADQQARRQEEEKRRAARHERRPYLVVLKKIPEGTTADSRALAKSFETIRGHNTPLIVAKDPAVIAEDLSVGWPHAREVVERILGDLRVGKPARLRPTLLVGEPGSGKTRLLTSIAGYLGLPSIVYPCASVADGSFGGTPAQWSSRRASTPLELIRTSGKANPVVVLDELEKSGQSPHNGSLVHSLLPMLEQHSAAAYFETALEATANLSMVSFLATANDLSTIPEPLRDRFRILRMPTPTIEHLPALAGQMLDALALERGVPVDMLGELAPDELEVIGRVWGGGSLRKLRTAVEATVDLRERSAVRQ